MSPISQADIEAVILRAVGSNAQIIDQKIEPFSKTRHGIMGDHHILSVTVKPDPLSPIIEIRKFFIKTVLRNSIVDECISVEEAHFLSEVYPLMLQVYKGPKWMPKCYLAKPETIVLEDVTTQGFSIRLQDIYDEDFLKAALASLASFHAASILLEEKLGQPLNKVYPDYFQEKSYTHVGKGGRATKIGIDTLVLIAERLGLDGSILPKALDHICELVKPEEGGCNVICHGDLWRSNIMFDDSSPPACLLVDYQMLCYTSPGVDLAHLLFIHSSAEFRRSSEARMLRHYYEVFSKPLGSRAPTFESLLRDYKERRIVGMAYSAQRWPPAIMAIRDDFDALQEWYFNSRIDVYHRLMDNDPAYEAEIRGYLEELIAEAKRVLSSN